MGYDVTLHSFSRKEFKFFVEDVVEKPQRVDSRVAAIHDKEEERAFLVQSIYERIPTFVTEILQETNYTEKTIGFAAAGILGYLNPYWYLRNGLLSKLMESPVFSKLTSNLSSLVSKEHKPLFDSNEGVVDNFSSGVYLSFENIKKFKIELDGSDFKTLVEETIGSENMPVLKQCLDYCIANELDLLEATDLCVPFSGESSTYPPNMKALHLKNISDTTNYSRKSVFDLNNDLRKPQEIDKNWWSNLNGTWRDAIRISYRIQVTSRFETYHLRNVHVDTKFADETLDLSEVGDIISIGVQILNRENEPSTLAPMFDLPHVRTLNVRSFSGGAFDVRRVLAFPDLETLEFHSISVEHFLSLKELKHLSHLVLEDVGLKAAVLKKVKEFPYLKSMFLSSYRSVSFLQGNAQIEALTLGYTKGLKNMQGLKRLNLFPKEANPKIVDCPNIEFINCYYARRLKDLSPFVHLEKLKTLLVRASGTAVDLSLLNEMKALEEFFVDSRTKLETIPKPVTQVKRIYVLDLDKIEESTKELIDEKFPNAKITKYVHSGYK